MIQLQAMRKTVELMDGVLNKAFENGTGEEFSYLDKLDPSLQPPHVRDMLEVMESNDNPQHPGEAFSDAKMGRWLGWAQAAVVAMGLASLEDMKEINRAEPSPSTPTPAALLPCPACESETVAVGLLALPSIVNGHLACCGSCGVCGPEQASERSATEAWNAMPRRPSPPPSGDVEARALAQGIMNLLPDNPHDALAVIALVFANVSVATGCDDDNALTAVRVALRQMHEGMKM